MKTEFTKGEWKVEFLGDLPKVATDDFLIADVTGNNGDEAEANAKLISAAPDLLKALEDIVSSIENNYGAFPPETKDTLYYKYAKSAIKKATL